mmetsp:Transcript_35549/g.63447  ORF Transcript_35549/g.63447 Transcript_35549/m.63447 type:complete len:113 (+) Transcript_35549:1311-1649(+)
MGAVEKGAEMVVGMLVVEKMEVGEIVAVEAVMVKGGMVALEGRAVETEEEGPCRSQECCSAAEHFVRGSMHPHIRRSRCLLSRRPCHRGSDSLVAWRCLHSRYQPLQHHPNL